MRDNVPPHIAAVCITPLPFSFLPSAYICYPESCTACNLLTSITGANEFEEEDALEEFLDMLIQMKNTNPLKYWNNMIVNGMANTALACMALNILSTPSEYLTFISSVACQPCYDHQLCLPLCSDFHGCSVGLFAQAAYCVAPLSLTHQPDSLCEHCSGFMGAPP